MIRIPVSILVILLALFLNDMFYAFSSALRCADEEKLKDLAGNQTEKYKFIQGLLDDPKRFIRTTYSVSVAAAFLSAVAGEYGFASELAKWLRHTGPGAALPVWAVWLLASAAVFWIITVVFLAFGFLLPKKRALAHPEQTLLHGAHAIRVLLAVMTPVSAPASGLTSLIARALRMDPDADGEEVTERELISIVDEAHEQGVIEKNEAEMIQNVMSLRGTTARDVMTHRQNIHALDGSLSLKDAMQAILEGANSRYPVYLENIDNITGILHIRDAMREYVTHPEKADTAISAIPGLTREAAVFPESRPVDSLLQYMQSRKDHLLICIDEYGQTSGVIAMEDILEEIVGNILDEYDTDEHYVQKDFDGSLVMDGLIPLEQAEKVLQTSFGTDEFETLSGYLTAKLGHIPTDKDRVVSADGFLFQILKIKNHTIRKVRAVPLPKEEGEKICQDIQNSRT